MRTFDEYRALFQSFYDRVKTGHAESARPHRGHGLDHDVTVAQLAARIAPDDRTADKAWCGGMLHSTDRTVDYKVSGLVEQTIRCLAEPLSVHFAESDLEDIIQSALRHGELNQDDQSMTQICVMDADRVVNLQPAVVIRAGQLLAEKPALEFEYLFERNPSTTYREPCSVLDDLRNNIAEYIPKLRLPEAIALGRAYAAQLEAYIASVRASNAELSLVGIEL